MERRKCGKQEKMQVEMEEYFRRCQKVEQVDEEDFSVYCCIRQTNWSFSIYVYPFPSPSLHTHTFAFISLASSLSQVRSIIHLSEAFLSEVR